MNKPNYYELLIEELRIKRTICLQEVAIQKVKADQYMETIDSLEKAMEAMEEEDENDS